MPVRSWFFPQQIYYMRTRLVGAIPPSYPACSLHNNGYTFLWFDLSVRSNYPSERRNLLIVSA
jgi:prepilin-type processing-associated H-X9-DG protein